LCILGHSAKWRGWSLLDGIGGKFDAPRAQMPRRDRNHASAFRAARAVAIRIASRALLLVRRILEIIVRGHEKRRS